MLVFGHSSPLSRGLSAHPEADDGKTVNLRLAAARLDGLLLAPGETLSLWRTVGEATPRRGFAPGLVLHDGVATTGVGGGLCAAANLLHWLALHSELTVVERAEHSIDPFPDSERTVPWGTGCTVAYPRLDLRLRNDGDATYQLRVRVSATHLEGELRCDRRPAQSYEVYESDAEFCLVDGVPHRRNTVNRETFDGTSGAHLRDDVLLRNEAHTAYVPTHIGSVAPLARVHSIRSNRGSDLRTRHGAARNSP